MTDDNQPEVEPISPDDVGTGTVQENGMLYVGREHAGEVRWALERTGDGDGE